MIPHLDPRSRKPMPHINVKGVHPTQSTRTTTQQAIALGQARIQIELAIVRQALPMYLHAAALQPPRAIPNRQYSLIIVLQEEIVVGERDNVDVPERRLDIVLVLGERLQRPVDVAIAQRRGRRPMWVFRAKVVKGVLQDFDTRFPVAQAREEREELVDYGHVVHRELEHCEKSAEGLWLYVRPHKEGCDMNRALYVLLWVGQLPFAASHIPSRRQCLLEEVDRLCDNSKGLAESNSWT
jgi:hypothetical protein